MAFRLIFEAHGDDVRLVRRARVDMEPPGAPSDDAAHSPGVYAEVRDGLGRTLYQANLSAQMNQAIEVFSPEGAIERVDAPAQRKVVVVVAPELADAKTLVVVKRGESRGSRLERGGVRTDSAPDEEQELARVDLTADR